MKKKILALFTAIIMVAGLFSIMPMTVSAEDWSTYADTSWYDSNPTAAAYTISTPEELAGLAYIRTFENQTINLAKDIVLNEGTVSADSTNARNWTPIGANINYSPQPFKGTFNGNNHTISGIYINSSSYTGSGLFGYSTGTVKNVGVVNSYIKVANNQGSTVGDVGGVVGINTGLVENCYNTGLINATQSVGGIVGKNTGSITNCYNTGKVEANYDAGGVAGQNTGSITNCYNTGQIGAPNYIAGISAINNGGSIINCYNKGVLYGNYYVGGIAGYNSDNSITNCYNTGIINGYSNFSAGIAAYIKNCQVTNCYNIGAVIGVNSSGGVVGKNDTGGTISNTYYYGSNIGVGNGAQTGTTPFIKLEKSSINVDESTSITETNPAWTISSSLGANFAVSFPNYQSPLAQITGTNIKGSTGGTDSITGTMAITQNELTSTGFTGAAKTINVPISLPLTVVKVLAAPTITVAPIASAVIGTTIPLEAAITNGDNPTGTVTFKDGPTTIGSTTTITNGIAAFDYVPTSTSSLSITAVYSGDTNNITCTSPSQSVTVSKETPLLSLSADPVSPGTLLNDVILTAAISNKYDTLSGQTITLTIDGTPYTAATNESGVATYTFTPASVKTYSITANFAGDTNNNSASSNLSYEVGKGSQAAFTIVNLPAEPLTYGDSNFTIATSDGAPAAYESSDLNVLTITSTGEVTIVGAGSATITATRDGNEDYNAITAAANFTINKKDLTILNIEIKDKTYDGTKTAEFEGTPTLSGVIGSDDITLENGTPRFASKNYSASAIDIDFDFHISGDKAENYTLIQPNSVTAKISREILTASTNSKSILIGDDLPTFDVTVTGFVNGEDDGLEDYENPIVSHDAINSNEAGDYSLTISGGNPTANYKFSYQTGAKLTIDEKINAEAPSFSTNLSGETTYFINDTADELTVTATVTDDGTVSYKWYENTENNTTDGTAITGETTNTFSPPTDTIGTYYYYVIAKNTNDSVNGDQTSTTTSSVKTIIVSIAPPTISKQPKGVTVNVGEKAALSVAASGSETLSYQWYSNKISSIGGTAITGAATSSYSAPTKSAGTTYYYCIVTDTDSDKSTTTNVVQVKVISNSNPYTPSNPSKPTRPSDSPSSSYSSISSDTKTIMVIETPAGIENPQLIGVTASDNAFDESVEVRLKDDATARQTIEQALTEKFADINKDLTIFPLDISLYIKGTNTKVQPNADTSVEITCPIPLELLTNKDNIKIVCVINGEIQVLPTKVLLNNEVYCVIFTASHFSPYAFVVDKDGNLATLAAGAPTTDNTVPIYANGLPYMAVSIGLTVLGIAYKHRKIVK